jgi:hypothetical protein
VNSVHYLSENTKVHLKLEGTLPIFRERYVSPQAGTVELRGFWNPTAHLELLDGTRYRTLSPKRDEADFDQMAYPIVHSLDKSSVCRVRTPIVHRPGTDPRLRYKVTLYDQQYVYRQLRPGQRGFELWDALEVNRLVRRESARTLVPELFVLSPVPTLLVLLFPWLDHQHLTAR